MISFTDYCREEFGKGRRMIVEVYYDRFMTENLIVDKRMTVGDILTGSMEGRTGSMLEYVREFSKNRGTPTIFVGRVKQEVGSVARDITLKGPNAVGWVTLKEGKPSGDFLEKSLGELADSETAAFEIRFRYPKNLCGRI